MKVLVTQSCPTLCDPMVCGPPGSSVHGILQAEVLEWVAIPCSRGSSQPRDQSWSPALWVDSLPSEPPGSPTYLTVMTKTEAKLQVRSGKSADISFLHYSLQSTSI